MNRNDVNKIMAILEVAYPNWIAKLEDEKLKIMLNMWTEMFEDDDPNLVATSVKAIMLSDPSPFPPTIGAIKAKMYELSHPDDLNEQEAWNLMSKAILNSGYNSKQEYEKLPDVLKALTTPSLLREYSQMSIDEVQTVIASNFMRSYRAKKEKIKEYKMLPNNMQTLLGNIREQLKLSERGNDEASKLSDIQV